MTEKQGEEVYRGIHYIRVSELPDDQQSLFKEWLPSDQRIKIMIQKEIMDDCVQYHHYEHWFDNVYPAQESIKMEVTKEVEKKSNVFNFSLFKSNS